MFKFENNYIVNKNLKNLIFIGEIVIVCFYALFIILEFKEFTIWSQVGDFFFESSFNERFNIVLQLFSEKHPHAMRVALIYPIYQLADLLNMDVKLLYSLIILFLFITINQLLIIILKKSNINYYLPLILLFLLSLSLFMHGRITFAMFGNTLLLYTLFTKTHFSTKMKFHKFLFYIIIALWFCSVSSGTFMVAIGSILLYYFFHILIDLPYIQKRYIVLSLILIVLIILLSPTIIQLIEKNLNYYDGSFLLMLNHGFGKYIVKYYYVIGIFLFLFPFLLMKSVSYLKRNPMFILPLSMISTSLFIGIFGFSSLVSGLPAYILFIYMFLNKNYLKVSHNV